MKQKLNLKNMAFFTFAIGASGCGWNSFGAWHPADSGGYLLCCDRRYFGKPGGG